MNRHLGGFMVHQGPMYQQGYGLGGYFSKFFKWIVPIAEKHALPHLKSGLQAVTSQALDSVSEIAKDAARGRNVRAAVEERVSQAIDNLKLKAEKTMRGEGRKRKRIVLKTTGKNHKNHNHNDIFDNY